MNTEKISAYIIIVALVVSFFVLGAGMCGRYMESTARPKIESTK